MIIKSLELENFRNYKNLHLYFDEGTNILTGENAQGKTNILEAIYLCSTTKSHKGSKDSERISKKLKVSDLYKEGKKTLSFEIFPPKKDKALEAIDETLDVLCELEPDFISVTFGAGGSAGSNNTIEIAKKIKHNYGVEPVVHLTSLHYSKSEIDEFAAALQNEGIENLLPHQINLYKYQYPSNSYQNLKKYLYF